MTKDRIFNAARTLLAQEGLPGLSIRKIAKECDLSPMAIYRHFADKDALINALMADGIATWTDRVRAIEAVDPMDWLNDEMEAFLAFALDDPHRFDAAFFLPASEARQFPDDFAAGRSPALALMIERITQAQAAGRLNAMPALDIALTLAALGQGLVSMYRARRFSGESQFRTLFRSAMQTSLTSFSGDPE